MGRVAGRASGSDPDRPGGTRPRPASRGVPGPRRPGIVQPMEMTFMALIRSIAELGHPVLRAATVPVTFPASDAVRALVNDLLETLRDANGVGIAAPQVYESSALFIVASRPNPRYPDAPLMEPEVVINPEILERSDEMVKGWEGCLSIPGIRGDVPRHRRIRGGIRPSTAGSSRRNSATSSPASSSTRTTTSAGSSSSTGSRARGTSSPRRNIRDCACAGFASRGRGLIRGGGDACPARSSSRVNFAPRSGGWPDPAWRRRPA